MTDISRIIDQIDNLKPLPNAAQQILAMVDDPKCAVNDIAEVIQYEPLITATLLKICNSAFFGMPRQIESVKEAAALLGLNTIVELVLSNISSDYLNNKQPGYGLNEGELWQQAVSTALVAASIAKKRVPVKRTMIFTTALLKDIGKVILDRYVVDIQPQIRQLIREKEYSFNQAEKSILGIDHAEVGSLIAERWQFSPKMVYVIRNHHLNDQDARQDIETCIVYLADTVSYMEGFAKGADGGAYKYYEDVFRRLEIAEKDLGQIIAEFKEQESRVKHMIPAL